MIKENISIDESVTIVKDVEKKVKTVGVRGLDFNQAKELGLFQRISNTLCVVHSCIVAAYRVYGDADYLLSEIGAKKNEIAKAMNDYVRAFSKFFSFWTTYYTDANSKADVMKDTESLYHRLMDWADLPENWQLGDEQKLKRKNVAIKAEIDDDVYYFHTGTMESKEIGDAEETWCVTKYDRKEHKQTTVNVDLDKASAVMVAKRLSVNDTENIYTASRLRIVTEENTNVLPFKVYYQGNVIGNIKNIT